MSYTSTTNDYTVGRCYSCGTTIWEGDDYLYANPYTGEEHLNQPSWEYTELYHSDCTPGGE